VRSYTYEITFTAQAGNAVLAEFDDCEVIVGSDTTTLHAVLPDQEALWRLVQRIIGLGLQVIQLNLLAPSPEPSEEGVQASNQSRFAFSE
jgi:hypothetical protein